MPHSPVRYRCAVPEDLAAVCELGQEVNRIHHEAWPKIFAAPSEPLRDERHWQSFFQGERSVVFIAESSRAAVGFVVVQLVDESVSLLQPRCHAKVVSVCVAAPVRGQGIGRGLMAEAEAWAASNGANEVSLSVWKFNSGALRLYEELGYEVRSLSLAKPLVQHVA